MSMTASTKDEFSDWMHETMIASKADIEAKDPSILYDVDGNAAALAALDPPYKAEFGKIAGMKKILKDQIKLVNTLRNQKYACASAIADGISGHMGKSDTLSKEIHKKRESLSNPKNRGPRKPKIA